VTVVVNRVSPSLGNDPILNDLIEEVASQLQAGKAVDLEAYARKHPDYAEQLRQLLPAVQVLADLGSAKAAGVGSANTLAGWLPAVGGRLGDYRIRRPIGRGGMGVVYEAEQVSLGRRVALKVLPVEAARDGRVLARFQRESRAAAQLHHSNIVPVFEVGQQGNVSFYAMQYIEGQPLDQVIQELQQLRAASGGPACRDTARAAGAGARSLLTGPFEPAPSRDATRDAQPEPGEPQPAAAPAPPTPAARSEPSERSLVAWDDPRYCRQVARMGLQVAEALAYAHGRGVVHRDIKPSNLLLDRAGIVWVSDFGLAKTQEQALTETGDLVGTVRYMAPERFGGVCDVRADVYALGLTLYELLVLQPAFDGQDRLHLVEQIGRQEPARLRTLDPRIPRDLETLVMKAIEKDPRRRYASADDLAEDLRRFLADEPILARRIGPVERLGRWGRRNPLVAALSAAVVLVAALGFAGVFGQMQVAQANEREAKQHAAQAEQQKQNAKAERDEAQRQRDEVQALNDRLQRTLYAAHMNLAQQAWEAGDIQRVLELLAQHRPKPGETDLRHFEWYHLYRLCHADLLTLKGHIAGLPADRSVAFSPDGKRLADAAGWLRKGEVKVWDAQTGQELLTLKGGSHGVVFSLDGKRVVSSRRYPAAGPVGSGEAKVWDAQTGQELLTLKGHTYGFGSLIFSPDGKRLVSCDRRENTLKVWDAQTGQELLSLKGAGASAAFSVVFSPFSVVFSPDGHRLLTSAASDGTVTIWDATPLPEKP
jgi:hypothetical protein